MATSAEKPTFKGSCHCGFVTYTVGIEPDNRSATRCNCTWCQKTSYTNLNVDSKDFTLLTPSSKGEMADYNPKGGNIHRYFCGRCGTHILREGSYEYNNVTYPIFKVNLLTIVQPQDGIDIGDFNMDYCDGLSGKFATGDKPFAGGTV